MNNYLYIISLRYCPFCINTRRLLEENNIKHHDNIIKDEEKFKYKTQEISTFPQIYYVKNKLEKKVLIGGNSDLEDIIDLNNNIKTDTNKQMDQLITNFLSTHPKIKKKILLKVLYLINKKDIVDMDGGSYNNLKDGSYNNLKDGSYNNLKGGYDQNLFTAYSASQITPELFKNFLGKAIIFISGKQKSGFFSSYNNKMEIYEILEYNKTRDNLIQIKANLVQWECHDIYCTMKRRSDIILTPELIQEKFVDIEFTQFLVTKDNYKIVEKQKQDLTKLKPGDIIPLLSKYGDYQGQYLVSEEDIDADIQSKYFFYVVSITNSNIIPLVESNKKDNLEQIAKISEPVQLIKSDDKTKTQTAEKDKTQTAEKDKTQTAEKDKTQTADKKNIQIAEKDKTQTADKKNIQIEDKKNIQIADKKNIQIADKKNIQTAGSLKKEDDKLKKEENKLKKDLEDQEQEPEIKIDIEKSTYQISSFGFEIGHRVDTYPINENKSYNLGSKNVGFFKNLIDSTTDGNWIILEKF